LNLIRVMPAEGSQLSGLRPNVRGSAESRLPGARAAAFQMAESDSTITITLNGEPYTLDGDARLLALVERLKMRPARIGVEINRQVVAKARYADTVLKAGDHVEIINFVGGG
jgi:sulfur carrier protein